MSRPGVTVRGDELHVAGAEAMAEAVVRLDQAGQGFRAPLYRAASASALSFLTVMEGRRIPSRYLEIPHPLLVIVSDDHSGARGPDGWPQARRLLRWARGAVLHAAAGRAEDYAMIATATVACRRMLLVEMQYRHMAAWAALAEQELPRPKVLRIVPREGVHPIMAAPPGTVLQ